MLQLRLCLGSFYHAVCVDLSIDYWYSSHLPCSIPAAVHSSKGSRIQRRGGGGGFGAGYRAKKDDKAKFYKPSQSGKHKRQFAHWVMRPTTAQVHCILCTGLKHKISSCKLPAKTWKTGQSVSDKDKQLYNNYISSSLMKLKNNTNPWYCFAQRFSVLLSTKIQYVEIFGEGESACTIVSCLVTAVATTILTYECKLTVTFEPTKLRTDLHKTASRAFCIFVLSDIL